MTRYDLFVPVHKALRAAMFEAAAAAARADFDRLPELEDAVLRTRRVLAFLREHAEHEERVLLPVVARHCPDLVAGLRREHGQAANLERELEVVCSELVGAGPARRASLGRRLLMLWHRLIAEHLRHMEREEAEANRVLWAHYSDTELDALHADILASIEAGRLTEWVELVLPALSAPERERAATQVPKRNPAGSSAVALILALSLALFGCSESEPSPPEPPPARLADTGLYLDIASGTVHPDNLPYSPQYPLWSDGARKRRWIRIPEGAAIDASDPDAWGFPPGTRLWKEFAFDRKVETRFLERRADGTWHYAAYLWNEAGTDAVLAPERGVRGAWRSEDLCYDVPARTDCRVCHESGAGPVLGFTLLQLSPDRDPLAPHAEQPEPGSVDLPDLQRRGLLRGLPPGLLAEPPRIAARSPRERAALGYLHANCGACHNDRGPLAELGLGLHWRLGCGTDAPALASAPGRASRFCPPDLDPATALRIAPGEPQQSVLVHRIAARDPITRMPPLATRVVDTEALSLLTAWIRTDLATGTNPVSSMERKP